MWDRENEFSWWMKGFSRPITRVLFAISAVGYRIPTTVFKLSFRFWEGRSAKVRRSLRTQIKSHVSIVRKNIGNGLHRQEQPIRTVQNGLEPKCLIKLSRVIILGVDQDHRSGNLIRNPL